MKNIVFGLLSICLLICGPANAQLSEELMQADSFIQSNEYEKALQVVNHTIDQKPSRFVLSQAYYQLSRVYLGLNDYNKAIYHNRQSLVIRKNLHYEFIADNYMLFGLVEMKRGDNDKALGYLFKATELPYETVEFSGLLYAYIAQVYYRKNKIDKVLKYYTLAMQTLQTAFEEATQLDLNHYRIRSNRLHYDNFFVGYL